MKFYLFIAILYSLFTPVFGQDTITVSLQTVDSSFYQSYMHVHGGVYTFQNRSDSTYIELKQNLGIYDMGQVSCYPKYNFKSTIPDGIYQVYIDSLLVEVVQFKNNKRTGRALSYEYDFRENERGWSHEKDIQRYTPTDCRIRQNTFNLMVYIHVHTYKNGTETNTNKSVYIRKRKLCRYTPTDEENRVLNFMINRGLRMKDRTHKKVKCILL